MNLYDIPLVSIQGEQISTDTFTGKKVLIVNVASACGYTPQYGPLQELYEHHHDKLVILGCPCNDFGAQEAGTEKEITTFCETHFGVTFPMTQKMGILKNTHPLYQWLCEAQKNGVADYEVTWNFQKFLIDEQGNLFKSLAPEISPLDDEILAWISG